MDGYIWAIIAGVVFLIAGLAAGYMYRKNVAEKKIGRAEDAVKKLVDDAQKRAEAIKKETVLEAKEEVHKLRNEFDRESKERRNEQTRIERRLLQREEVLDKKIEAAEEKEETLNKRLKDISKTREDIQELHRKELAELEKIADMSKDEAKSVLLEKVEHEARHDMAVMLRDVESKAKSEAEKKAR